MTRKKNKRIRAVLTFAYHTAFLEKTLPPFLPLSLFSFVSSSLFAVDIFEIDTTMIMAPLAPSLMRGKEGGREGRERVGR